MRTRLSRTILLRSIFTTPTKTQKPAGYIEEDKAGGIRKYAEPLGVIAAVIPTTNPTSTVIFKTLIALKTRNGIIISPHPRAKNSAIEAAKLVLEAAVEAGTPEGIIGWIDEPSSELSGMVMKELDLRWQRAGREWLRPHIPAESWPSE